MRKFAVRLTGFAAFGIVALPLTAGAYTGERYAKDAKITLAEARASALKARPGAITDQELEKEKGGSGLRYSFDVKSGGKIYEVGIDAKTGALLENGPDGPD